MLIKKDKRSLYSIPVFSFFNKRFVSIILKFFGIIHIIVLVFFVYMAVALDKGEIKTLIHSVAQQTYWFGKMLTNLPIKWSNNISSNHSVLNISIAPKDYQLLMTLKDAAVKKEVYLLREYKRRFPVVVTYNDDKFDARIRLKGDSVNQHQNDSKFSVRITLNNDTFLGMKAFSLQHPKRRSYMSSFLLHKFTEKENLLTKRFNLVPVAINGKYMGIYNYEEVVDHNMTESLTGVNNIVVVWHDDEQFADFSKTKTGEQEVHSRIVSDYYHHSRLVTQSFNEVMRDTILKKDFERASKLLNGFRNGNFTASEIFDIDKLALWLAMTDLFGSYHGAFFNNVKLVYDRDLDRFYPLVWDAFSENAWASLGFHKYNMFKLNWIYRPIAESNVSLERITKQMVSDQKVMERYLAKLDEITQPGYIDNVVESTKSEIDDYMSKLRLDYPEFKMEDEINRIKDNAYYLRHTYLYPDFPFNAYLSGDDNLDSLILVNRKPVPIKIISLLNTTTDNQFVAKGTDAGFILRNNIPGLPGTPTKVFFECPTKGCFDTENIEDMRIVAKVLGTNKNTSVKINNWVAY
jgi:hypothetical protein